MKVVDLGVKHVRQAIWPLRRLIKEKPPEILISHLSHANLAAILALRPLKIPTRLLLVEHLTMSAYQGTSVKDHLIQPLARWLFKSADAVAAVSEGAARDLEKQLRMPPESVHVLYNPVVDELLRQKCQEPLSHPWAAESKKPLIVGMGRLTAQKDFGTLIRAFARMANPADSRLVILGEGPRLSRLEKLAAELGITEDLELPGFVRNPFAYTALEKDDRPGERPPPGFERTFPHVLPEASEKLYALLRFTPFGDELLLDFVRTMILDEELGQRGVTDFLAVSFSCSDSIGHAFGPESLEAEDNLLRLDETLSQLFLSLQEEVGLENCLIVLSSDHGCDTIPEERHLASCEDKHADEVWAPRTANEGEAFLKHVDSGLECCEAGRHFPADWIAGINRKLARRWNLGQGTEPLLGFWNPSVYLDESWFAEQTLEREVVERIIAAELRQVPGIARVYERHRLVNGSTPRSEWVAMVERGFHEERSGDWIVVQDPFWFLNPVPGTYAAMHGSPYAYDTHVPVLIAGAGIDPSVVHRRISPVDIAPTIAAIVGIPVPSASVGTILAEALPKEPSSRTRALEATWRR